MAMHYTDRLGIPTPDENDGPVDIPATWAARAAILDVCVPHSFGPLSSRPTSSPGTPGLPGRAFLATDQADSPRLDWDSGTGWITVGPAPADGAANVPSRRTLGNGPTQACAGNDPRLVGGAAASGDLSGTYPGPMTVNTWAGQTKSQAVASVPPQHHASSHNPSGGDPLTGLTDASMVAANKDGAIGTPSMRTLGQGAQQAAAGNDARFGGILVPGDIVVSAAATRAGCLLCNGQAVSRSTYAALYAAIGTAYGAGDGASTFNLPDYQGRTIVGAGAGAGLTSRARGQKYGAETHYHTMPDHTHLVGDHTHGLSDNGGAQIQAIAGNRVAFGDNGGGTFTATSTVIGQSSSTISEAHTASGLTGHTDGMGAFVGTGSQIVGGSQQTMYSDTVSNVPPSAVANVFIKI